MFVEWIVLESAKPDSPVFTEWIAPTIAGVFALTAGIVAGVMARRGAKIGNRENRAPDVQEMWAQQEQDRRMRQIMEDLWWQLWRTFQAYYRRIIMLGTRFGLTEDQLAQLEPNAAERRVIELRPPEDA